MPPSNPVIVLPGIIATYLRDDYPIPPEQIWTVLTKDYDRAALHPDDLRYESRQPARVLPGQLYEVAYRELVEELRYNLREHEDEPVPVYPFGYDWRQPLDDSERQLADFVAEVIDRTKLLPQYHRAGYAQNPKVNLVGHSMGGLIIAGYLERAGGTAPVDKVATLASPFQGSYEAVIKVATGTANLGTEAPSSREREAARVTPALYHLMPSFPGAVRADPGIPDSLFDAGAWQPSVIETLEEYIRLRGLDARSRTARRQQARQLFDRLLQVARDHRRRLDGFRLQSAGLAPEDWLCVVGVNAKTRVRLSIVRRNRAPEFAFASADRDDLWDEETDPALRRLTGDGTVPFAGAVPRFLAVENLVCVTPGDFGYWEIGDLAMTRLAGFHGILPNMDMLHRLIVRHFTGRPDRRGNTWGRRVPGVADWKPPLDLRERS